MMTKTELSLVDAQETALISLAVKASETKRNNPRITDNKAVEIVEQLGIDASKYDKFMSHEGAVSRTLLFDGLARGFITELLAGVNQNVKIGDVDNEQI